MYGKSTIMSSKHRIKETVTVSTDAKTTLPKETRRYLDVEEGEKITFQDDEDGNIQVVKAE